MTVKKNYYFQGVLFNTLNKIFKFCDKLGIFSVVKLQIGSQKGHDHILQKFYLHGHVEIKKRKEKKNSITSKIKTIILKLSVSIHVYKR